MARARLAREWGRRAGVATLAARRWLAPQTSLFAAALGFQALLALVPILLVLARVAGPLLGRETARQSLAEAAVRFAGPGADRIVSALIELVAAAHGQTTRTLLGVSLLLFFASSFFARSQMALDAVWGVEHKKLGRKLVDRAISLGQALLAVGVSLLVLAAGAVRAVVRPLLTEAGAVGALAWEVWTRVGTLLMTVIVLAAAFRYIPFVRPRPRLAAVLAGAVPAALALHLANEVIGLVVSRSALVPLFGAGGTLVAILVWAQYSASIVLFGAHLCRAWGETNTGVLRPDSAPPAATRGQ